MSNIPHAKYVIQHLLSEQPPAFEGQGQTPAIECGVLLRGTNTVINGSLSVTSWGGLRMLSGSSSDQAMVEQFFDYDAVLVIAVVRPVTVQPRIILQQ